MAKGAVSMKISKLIIAVGVLGLLGMYAVESSRISVSSPPATEASAAADPIAVASDAYIPPSGGTDQECNDLLKTIGVESMLASAESRAIADQAKKEFKTKCMPGN